MAPFVDDFGDVFGDSVLNLYNLPHASKTTRPNSQRIALVANQYQEPLVVASEPGLTHFALPDVSRERSPEVFTRSCPVAYSRFTHAFWRAPPRRLVSPSFDLNWDNLFWTSTISVRVLNVPSPTKKGPSLSLRD